MVCPAAKTTGPLIVPPDLGSAALAVVLAALAVALAAFAVVLAALAVAVALLADALALPARLLALAAKSYALLTALDVAAVVLLALLTELSN